LANHKSSAKRARQTIRREARNTSVKSAVKSFERKVVKALDDKSAKDAVSALSEFTSKVMSAVTKGVIKKETASRKVGRLSTRVSSLSK
jgi:small subunit ribosomal protein S20